MTGTILDALEEPRSGTIVDLVDKVDHLVPDEYHDEEVPWYKSYASALGKGLIKGTVSLGRMMGPLDEPYDPNRLKELLDEYLPSEEGFVEEALERGGKLFPLVATGGGGAGSAALRTTGAAISGQVAKEFGAPEWAQSLAELPSFIGPDIKKMIQAGKKTKDILEFGRSKGLKEEQLAPLIQGAKKQKVLGKLAFKRGRGQSVIKETQKALGDIYKDLYNHPQAKTVLNEFEAGSKIEELEKIILKIPNEVRKKIIGDFVELKSSPKAAEDFMNFYADINANLSGKTKQLSALKEPVIDAIKKIDSGLSIEFQKTNELYSKWAQISKTLSPNLASDLIEGSIPLQAVYGLAHGAVTGDVSFMATALTAVAGEVAVKQIAAELLINPRFQNLGNKMITAIKNNKFAIAKSVWGQMTQEVDKVNKNAAKKLKEIDILKLFEESEG